MLAAPQATPEAEAYDPAYDPILDGGPGAGRAYAPTYWIDTAGVRPADDGPLLTDAVVDTVVVGSGYTGLNCAIGLARDHGREVMVLEANAVAWGCSTRNGGQAQISTGRLKRSQWIARWGERTARALHAELDDAWAYFERGLDEAGIDCDARSGGHYYIAHKPSAMPALAAEVQCYNDIFGYRARLIGRDELKAEHVRDEEAHGALWEPHGTGVHAAKLAFGYQRHARDLGARIHVASPVLGWQREGKRYRVRTPNGTVLARNIAIATAGYTPPAMAAQTRHRLLPILSNSIVTRVLTPEEREAAGIRVLSPLTDTRTLRNYYRLLPDGRVQIGTRGAITGRDAGDRAHLDGVRAALGRKFPALAGIELDYSWWGWVDVSHDMMPRIVRPEAGENVFYAMGYGGNGVMYSAQAGRRLAQLVAGETLPDLPIFRGELPHHGLLTPFRRLGQRFMYKWYHFKDERR